MRVIVSAEVSETNMSYDNDLPFSPKEEIMLNFIKKYWKKAIAFAAALWPTVRLFVRWPMAMVSVATIPVQHVLQRYVNLGPVMSKVAGFIIFGMLMVVSWHVAEVIVVLAAIAFVMEAALLVRCIRDRLGERSLESELEFEAC